MNTDSSNKRFDISKKVLISVYLIGVILISYLCWHTIQSADSLPFNLKANNVDVTYSYLSTEQKNSPEQILKEEFKYKGEKNIPYELDDKFYWIKFEVNNRSNSAFNLLLHADNSMLDTFNIYQLNNRNESVEMALVNSFNSNVLNAEQSAFPSFSFELKAQQSTTYFIETRTFGPPNIPFILYEEAFFKQRVLATLALFAAFTGIIIIMMLYNFVLYMAVHDKVYLLYISYLVTSFIVISSINGIGNFIFSANIQQWLNNTTVIFHYLLVITLLLFTISFLRIRQKHIKLYKVGVFLALGIVALMLFSLTQNQIVQAKLFFSIQPICYLYSFVLIGVTLKQNFKWARFYYLSWIPVLIGGVVQPLMLLNHIDYSFIAKNAFMIAILVEVSLMAFALAERMRRNEKDRINDLLYYSETLIPRKVNIEKLINTWPQSNEDEYHVVVVKPEQIDQIDFYTGDKPLIDLYKSFYRGLSHLFSINDAIMSFNPNNEKIALINNKTFVFVIDKNKMNQPIDVLRQSIQKIISERYLFLDMIVPLSAHIGVATYPLDGQSPSMLLNKAQLAIKDASLKQDKFSFYCEENDKGGHKELQLATDIKKAIAADEYTLTHQPQIDLRTGRVCGSECLITWNHPTQGQIDAKRLIKIAEDVGLINDLSLWVIKTALKQQEQIIEEGYNNHKLSINISNKDISSKYFYDNLLPILSSSEIPADKIIFEVSESNALSSNEDASWAIEQFNEFGITLSIDDFGTGDSSLENIVAMPFAELKIDKHFVENLNESHKCKVILETIIKMAKGLKLEIVAEGISHEATEKHLIELGCDIGQGFFYAKPMEINEYLDWLKKRA